MTLPDILSQEQVREIAEDVEVGRVEASIVLACNAITAATPEIAATVLEMAAKRLERKAAELQIAKQTDEVLLNRAVRLDDADILRQLAKEFRDDK